MADFWSDDQLLLTLFDAFGVATPNVVNDQEKAMEETQVTLKPDGRVPVYPNPTERGEDQ